MGEGFPVKGLDSIKGEEPLVMCELDVKSCPVENVLLMTLKQCPHRKNLHQPQQSIAHKAEI